MTEPAGPRTEGLVLRIDAKLCHVDVAGKVHLVPLRGRLFEDMGQEKRPLAVGDRVVVSLTGEGGSVDERIERRNRLSRTSAGTGDKEQVVAANLDQVLVVAALEDPEFDPILVDHVIAGAEREGIDVALVFSKVDLVAPEDIDPWAKIYEALGYPVLRTSARTGAAIEEVRGLLRGRVSVLSGSSGVGKSSLLNAVDPALELRVGDISKRSRMGRHTTSHAQLLPIASGGHVVDTPGIRHFGLFGIKKREVGSLFREIEVLVGTCKYADCLHTVEQGCAVLAAVAAGKVARSRHASFLDVLEDARK
jgi:ribosome biogenesis GTPase